MVITALQSVLMLLTLILAGCFAASRPWFGETGSALFSKFTVQIAIPCYMFYNVWNTCGSREKLLEMFSQLPIPFCIILLGLAMGFLLARALQNSLGEKGRIHQCRCLFQYGHYRFSCSGSFVRGSGTSPGYGLLHGQHSAFLDCRGLSAPQGSRSLCAPLFPLRSPLYSCPSSDGFLLGAATVLADFHLPDFLMSAITMIKQMATPMAMIFIGSMIYKGGLQSFRPCKELLLVIACRFILTPMVVLLICLPMGFGLPTRCRSFLSLPSCRP